MNRIALFFSVALVALAGITGCHVPCHPHGYGPGPYLGEDCGVCGTFDGPFDHGEHMAGCGAGCGPVYKGEWNTDRPDDFDPCDHCGNYTGPSCRKAKPLFYGMHHLWGYRYNELPCNDCGGTNCHGSCGAPLRYHEEPIIQHHAPQHGSGCNCGGHGHSPTHHAAHGTSPVHAHHDGQIIDEVWEEGPVVSSAPPQPATRVAGHVRSSGGHPHSR